MIRRGLTLLEVVAATVLLTLVAAACLPLLVEGRRWAEGLDSPNTVEELVSVADDFINDSSAFGFEDASLADPGFSTEIRSKSDAGDAGSIRVRLLTAEDSDHAWMLFEFGRHSVLRFVPLPEPEPTEETNE